MEDRTVQFLLQASSLYSSQCPQLTAHLMSGLSKLGEKKEKSLPPWVAHSHCPHCSTPLTPHTTSQRTISARSLRVKRRKAKLRECTIPSLITGKSRHYMIVHCKSCDHFHVSGIKTPSHQTPSHTPGRTPSHTPGRTPSHTPRHTPLHTPGRTPSNTPQHTPSHTPLHKRCRSSTLKNMLAKTSLQTTPTIKPKLADFLDTV